MEIQGEVRICLLHTGRRTQGKYVKLKTQNRSEATMPLYEFKCNKCDHTFDKIMTIKEMETASPPCPKCGSDKVKKIMSSGRIKSGLDGYAGKIK